MAKLTETSIRKLEECAEELQLLISVVANEIPIHVICGHRNKKDQNDAFKNKRTKLQWPKSKHNQKPSKAVDITPRPLDWQDIDAFNEMLDIVERNAKALNIKIRLGRDFSFKDYPHIELV